ncbi:hypothetical protein AX17_006212 [Amanita inopinata Kibby_2008]|nr:hypothetical protein AX17_006212 [Amanita inopinata Kibby_2008]
MAQEGLIGSIIERKTSAPSNRPLPSTSGKTGFPAVQHRSRSAFVRSRDEMRKTGIVGDREVPRIVPSNKSLNGVPGKSGITQGSDSSDWRTQMSEENLQLIDAMTEVEREEEKRQILERFGPEVGNILRRAKEPRVKVTTKGNLGSFGKLNNSESRKSSSERSISPPPALSANSTRPSSRADRKLRFAELQPHDVHVYESAPPSPRKKPLALLPPSGDESAISLGHWRDKSLGSIGLTQSKADNHEPVEGTPEYIRRRYFPDAPPDDPNLAWMMSTDMPTHDTPATPIRFDLSGNVIPPETSLTLPTHLGLHHHADGTYAGYTLDDIFLLSRSTVPAQRATMLGVLARIAEKIARIKDGNVEGFEELVGKEEEMRTRILAAGLEALSIRGGVGVRAIELVWVCIAKWDEKLLDIRSVEMQNDLDSAILSIPFDHVLPQIVTIYSQGDAAADSLVQLLAILRRLAHLNNDVATKIMSTPGLVSNMVRTHIMIHTRPLDSNPFPEPATIELLDILALASRRNAEALVEYADALLRFVAILPPNSPYPTALAVSLLTCTLRFYSTLGGYGLYSHVTSTAMSQLIDLGRYIQSPACSSRKVMSAWANLLSVWITCAIDPHRTTPTHDILWSQVVGWGWNSEILDLRSRLGTHGHDREVWGAMWSAEAAWLEGSRINAVRRGQEERAACLAQVREGFAEGKEKRLVEDVLDVLHQRLIALGALSFGDEWMQNIDSLNLHAQVLTAAINFWLSCTPPLAEGPICAPPFLLPFSRISEICAQLITHPLWTSASNVTAPYSYALCRSLSSLLLAYLGMSRRLPGTTQDLWMAQALSIISRLLPGHEEFAEAIVEQLLNMVNVEWLKSKGYCQITDIEGENGFEVIKPFLSHSLRPLSNVYVSPSPPSMFSISLATTQRLPAAADLCNHGLPLKRDWTLSSLDHLLRSGTSPVFRELPESWNGSEVEVVRATLLLTEATRDILSQYSLNEFALRREEAIFGCMKIFMLEHEQSENNLTEEVFRDATVTGRMENLLQPYMFSRVQARPVIPSANGDSLEDVASRFLGSSMPFFQYYTDFVALYDAVSFSHPVFASLLLPPVSMTYAVDYRKHLWDDFGHILKTIRTRVDQVVTSDIREYLSPVDKSPQMVGLYLRALLKDAAHEFLQLLAVHHVASNIWPDLCEEDVILDENQACKLLKAVVEQGSKELILKIARYRQTKSGAVLLPPDCYGDDLQVRKSRWECVQRWGGVLIRRLEDILL